MEVVESNDSNLVENSYLSVKPELLTILLMRTEWSEEECKPVADALNVLASNPQAGDCKMIDEATVKRLRFLSVNGEKAGRQLCLKHNVQCVPAVLYFQGDKLLTRVEGLKVGEMVQTAHDVIQKFANHNALEQSIATQSRSETMNGRVDTHKGNGDDQNSLEDRLRQLTNQSEVVLFMKGDPVQPKCGFSRTTVALLDSIGVGYTHFDILKDEEVRQGLKKFSDWPTYPQLYVKGELIGGLDILKEMHAAGELAPLLKKS